MSQTNIDLSGSQHHVVLLNVLQACYGAVWLVVIQQVPEVIKLGGSSSFITTHRSLVAQTLCLNLAARMLVK